MNRSAKENRDKFSNSKKLEHLADIPEVGLEGQDDRLTIKCKFNFAYFCKQDGAGKDSGELTHPEIHDLFEKIRNFCCESLAYWKNQKHGISTTLSIYESFPLTSDFKHPKHVPHDVHWGRFRLSGEVRLVGFVVPQTMHGKEHPKTKTAFDCNTFYVVFIDHNHRFYISKRKK